MLNKPSNCVVWGERKDVSTFLQASDLFLFTSRGDKNNKELNPISIKEAIEYSMPMSMFNLDVYCGKYNNSNNIDFLTGDIDSDCDKIINLTSAKKEIQDDEIIIVSTYPNTQKRKKLTEDCIRSLYKTNKKIILCSHYPVSDKIQSMVDYYVYDKENELIHHSFYNKFYRTTDEFDLSININNFNNSNQSLAALVNLMNGIKLAKELGYRKVMTIVYDVMLDEKDLPLINDYFNKLDTGWKCCLATMDTHVGTCFETTSMIFKIDYFLEKFKDIRKGSEFTKLCESYNSHNFLEHYMMKVLENEENLWVIRNDKNTILPNSGLGTSSNSEYFSVLPISNIDNRWAIYFFTYNIDEREVLIEVKENDILIKSDKFKISDKKEYLEYFTYNGNPLDVTFNFIDYGEIYKSKKFEINETTIDSNRNNGHIKILRKPKIKLVHLQTTVNDDKEIKSRESLEPLSKFGIDYVLHKNELYQSLPPSHNCLRPQSVAMNLFNDDEIRERGTALTPAHYGCFESFKNGILSEFDSDLDFLIVCEGDCILEVSHEEFMSKVYQACEIINNEEIDYFSFGDTGLLESGWQQSSVISEIPNQDLLFITNKIIGIQCIMFPKHIRKFLFNQLIDHKWDAADLYFNIIFNNKKMGIVKKRLTTQVDGISFIDKQIKIFTK
jgi:hypothetical protein